MQQAQKTDSGSPPKKLEVHIEIHQRPSSGVPKSEIIKAVLSLLQESSHLEEGPIINFERHHRDLAKHVANIRVCDLPPNDDSDNSDNSDDHHRPSQSLTTKNNTNMMMDVDDDNNNNTSTSTSTSAFTSVYDQPTALDAASSSLPFWRCELKLHVYKLDGDGPSQEYTGGNGGEQGGEDDGISSLEQWALPSTSFEGLWENLIYDIHVKQELLSYCQTAMIFADSRVNSNVISWNRVVLLHGPPGTGKTSLCKALSHKLSIRLAHRYTSGCLLEINAHSLFSKWFSESGKLVTKLFDHIKDMVDDEDALVCVLIDEVESLTAARTGAASGAEPSDAIRVVNAVLTQIDQLRQRDNVLILTTSNISEAIDLAFVDRADIKQYIGLPSVQARYTILSSCFRELARCNIITHTSPHSQSVDLSSVNNLSSVDINSSGNSSGLEEGQQIVIPSLHKDAVKAIQQAIQQQNNISQTSQNSHNSHTHTGLLELQSLTLKLLLEASVLADGLSGRALRKLPFQAHAFYGKGRMSMRPNEYALCLVRAVRKEQKARVDLDLTSSKGSSQKKDMKK